MKAYIWGAASVLVNIGEPAVEVLITSLNNPDSVVRLRASWALGRGFRDVRAVRPLISSLNDDDWAVRMRIM